ncbi:hypothetical protein PVK06_044298 [Gossypium arboreum]|uniref:Uncharacterized protein n=1 Tax=Gossypium arboreum TaxID=29729 RepID=A0ABR0MQS6_GOSAR|nr:hypothetical protein PVK06_044298 [Gossypium arboreum]
MHGKTPQKRAERFFNSFLYTTPHWDRLIVFWLIPTPSISPSRTNTPCIIDFVMAELENLGQKYRVALRCSFMNFSRNTRCLKCKAEGPKKVPTDDVQMKKGDWNCLGERPSLHLWAIHSASPLYPFFVSFACTCVLCLDVPFLFIREKKGTSAPMFHFSSHSSWISARGVQNSGKTEKIRLISRLTELIRSRVG